MKKILTVILIVTLMTALLAPLQVSANPGITTFEIGSDIAAVRGNRVRVPVTVNNNVNGFAAVAFQITFDKNALSLENAVLRSASVNGDTPPRDVLDFSPAHNIKPQSDGTQWISIIDSSPSLKDWDGEGLLMELIFDVIAPVNIDRTNVDMVFTPDPNGAPVNAQSGQPINSALVNGGRGSVIIQSSSQGPGGDRPTGAFGVTIVNGGTGASGQGWYQPHTAANPSTVTINAGTPPAGQEFANWTASPALPAANALANANSAQTTFRMPANDVTLTANWRPIGGGGGTGTQHTVTVNSTGATGVSGSGPYAQGATVTINAGTRTGWTFVRWTFDPTSVTPASATTSPTTFTMPAQNVVASATWRNNATGDEETSGGGSGGTGSGSGGSGGGSSGGSGGGGFGNVPQTGIADISSTVALMFVSVVMTGALSVTLFFHVKSNRKNINKSYNGNK